MSFSLNSILNSKTLSQANDSHKVKYIERAKIVPNAYNEEIYSTNSITLLSYGIEDKGLLEPLLVKKTSNEPEQYTVISGHRRLLAIEALCKRNPEKASDFDYIPCIVRNDDDIKEVLVDANLYNRDKTDAEKAKELAAKKEKLEARKANGEKVSGKLLELIAEEMNISARQAKKLNAINKNATDSVKEAFDSGDISIETAYQLSRQSEDKQEEIMSAAAESEEPLTAQKVAEAVKPEEDNTIPTEGIPTGDNEEPSDEGYEGEDEPTSETPDTPTLSPTDDETGNSEFGNWTPGGGSVDDSAPAKTDDEQIDEELNPDEVYERLEQAIELMEKRINFHTNEKQFILNTMRAAAEIILNNVALYR